MTWQNQNGTMYDDEGRHLHMKQEGFPEGIQKQKGSDFFFIIILGSKGKVAT